ncbi:hypothetical protein BDZ88DRAFT_473229 [Geranomyces variabilis]|nr:hypothetical protein BDZ88DRAFT_473229 [Geranomyces variabilis]
MPARLSQLAPPPWSHPCPSRTAAATALAITLATVPAAPIAAALALFVGVSPVPRKDIADHAEADHAFVRTAVEAQERSGPHPRPHPPTSPAIQIAIWLRRSPEHNNVTCRHFSRFPLDRLPRHRRKEARLCRRRIVSRVARATTLGKLLHSVRTPDVSEDLLRELCVTWTKPIGGSALEARLRLFGARDSANKRCFGVHPSHVPAWVPKLIAADAYVDTGIADEASRFSEAELLSLLTHLAYSNDGGRPNLDPSLANFGQVVEQGRRGRRRPRARLPRWLSPHLAQQRRRGQVCCPRSLEGLAGSIAKSRYATRLAREGRLGDLRVDMEIRHVPRTYSDSDFLAAVDGYGLNRPVWMGVFLPEVIGDHARLLVSWASEMDAIEFYERAARDGYTARGQKLDTTFGSTTEERLHAATYRPDEWDTGSTFAAEVIYRFLPGTGRMPAWINADKIPDAMDGIRHAMRDTGMSAAEISQVLLGSEYRMLRSAGYLAPALPDMIRTAEEVAATARDIYLNSPEVMAARFRYQESIGRARQASKGISAAVRDSRNISGRVTIRGGLDRRRSAAICMRWVVWLLDMSALSAASSESGWVETRLPAVDVTTYLPTPVEMCDWITDMFNEYPEPRGGDAARASRNAADAAAESDADELRLIAPAADVRVDGRNAIATGRDTSAGDIDPDIHGTRDWRTGSALGVGPRGRWIYNQRTKVGDNFWGSATLSSGCMAIVFGANHDTWRAGPIVSPTPAEWANLGNQERTLSDSLRYRVLVAEQEQEKSEGRVADVGGRTSRLCRGEADTGTGGITDVSGHADSSSRTPIPCRRESKIGRGSGFVRESTSLERLFQIHRLPLFNALPLRDSHSQSYVTIVGSLSFRNAVKKKYGWLRDLSTFVQHAIELGDDDLDLIVAYVVTRLRPSHQRGYVARGSAKKASIVCHISCIRSMGIATPSPGLSKSFELTISGLAVIVLTVIVLTSNRLSPAWARQLVKHGKTSVACSGFRESRRRIDAEHRRPSHGFTRKLEFMYGTERPAAIPRGANTGQWRPLPALPPISAIRRRDHRIEGDCVRLCSLLHRFAPHRNTNALMNAPPQKRFSKMKSLPRSPTIRVRRQSGGKRPVEEHGPARPSSKRKGRSAKGEPFVCRQASAELGRGCGAAAKLRRHRCAAKPGKVYSQCQRKVKVKEKEQNSRKCIESGSGVRAVKVFRAEREQRGGREKGTCRYETEQIRESQRKTTGEGAFSRGRQIQPTLRTVSTECCLTVETPELPPVLQFSFAHPPPPSAPKMRKLTLRRPVRLSAARRQEWYWYYRPPLSF